LQRSPANRLRCIHFEEDLAMKILIPEKIAADSVDYLRAQGFEVDEKFGLSPAEIEDIMAPYDGLIVRSATQVTRQLLDKATSLKVVGRAGNGIDNIDVASCTEKGIVAINTPEANIMAAAELAVALSTAVFRNICQAYEGSHKGDFRRGKMVGNEMDGKTAGVIGLGRIGSIAARKLKGLGMRVIAFDPYTPADRFEKQGFIRCEKLKDLLKEADLITLHMPKTKETYNMIDADELALCKRGVRIVNAARGGLVNEKALYDALVSGQVAAAGIDVFDKEPDFTRKPEEQNFTNPLLTLPNVIYTPHLGASTHEANANVGTAITEMVAKALRGELVAAINMPSFGGDFNKMRPYASLAEKLGAIYYQAESTPVNKIEIIYSGELADKETGLLTLSVIKGFLTTITSERISFVNAKSRLTDLGVEIVESKSTSLERYTSLITVKFITPEKELPVSGTVFGKDSEILVSFFGYAMDFELSPYVLALQNNDVPGIIGRVGTILGQQNINIATMHWSRKQDRGRAQSFLSVDSPVDDATVAALKGIEGIIRVSVLNFNPS
jgi:D-3-phosphoglycerate dehydrogenase